MGLILAKYIAIRWLAVPLTSALMPLNAPILARAPLGDAKKGLYRHAFDLIAPVGTVQQVFEGLLRLVTRPLQVRLMREPHLTMRFAVNDRSPVGFASGRRRMVKAGLSSLVIKARSRRIDARIVFFVVEPGQIFLIFGGAPIDGFELSAILVSPEHVLHIGYGRLLEDFVQLLADRLRH